MSSGTLFPYTLFTENNVSLIAIGTRELNNVQTLYLYPSPLLDCPSNYFGGSATSLDHGICPDYFGKEQALLAKSLSGRILGLARGTLVVFLRFSSLQWHSSLRFILAAVCYTAPVNQTERCSMQCMAKCDWQRGIWFTYYWQTMKVLSRCRAKGNMLIHLDFKTNCYPFR